MSGGVLSKSSGSSRLVLTFWGKVRAVDTNTRTDAFLQQNERHFKLYSIGNNISVIVIFCCFREAAWILIYNQTVSIGNSTKY